MINYYSVNIPYNELIKEYGELKAQQLIMKKIGIISKNSINRNLIKNKNGFLVIYEKQKDAEEVINKTRNLMTKMEIVKGE